MRRRTPALGLLVCLGVPFSLLALSYAWLAVDRGTLALWSVEIHESGRYTLRETLLYFRHFLREIPTDVAYALFVLAAFVDGDGAEESPGRHRPRAPLLSWMAVGAAAALAATAFGIAAHRHGGGTAVQELLQFRTRDDLYGYGSHWRFHWLSTLWFGATVPLLRPSIARLFGHAHPPPGRGRRVAGVEWLAWGYFLGLTVAFGLSWEPFTDIRYVGHQAREILTHGPITGLLALGAVQLVAAWARPGEERCRGPRRGTGERSIRWFAIAGERPIRWLRLALFVGIPLYLTAIALSGDLMEAGQSEAGLAAMVGGHAFEHALDYLFVTLLAAGGYGACRSRRPRHA